MDVFIKSPDKLKYHKNSIRPSLGNLTSKSPPPLNNPVTSPNPSVRVHFPLARVWFCKEENGFLYIERLRTCLSVVWVLELGNQTTVASDTNPVSSLSDSSVLGSLWGFRYWGEVQSLIRFVVWRRIEISLSDYEMVGSRVYGKDVYLRVTYLLPHNMSPFLWCFFSPP